MVVSLYSMGRFSKISTPIPNLMLISVVTPVSLRFSSSDPFTIHCMPRIVVDCSTMQRNSALPPGVDIKKSRGITKTIIKTRYNTTYNVSSYIQWILDPSNVATPVFRPLLKPPLDRRTGSTVLQKPSGKIIITIAHGKTHLIVLQKPSGKILEAYCTLIKNTLGNSGWCTSKREQLVIPPTSIPFLPHQPDQGVGHVNKIHCFSSFSCLQKFGEGGGYLLFIFRGQRSYATTFTGVKLGYKRRVKGKTGTIQVKKEWKRTKKKGFNLSRMLTAELHFYYSQWIGHVIFNLSLVLHASNFLGTASLSLA